jgi:hypothetical protein
VRILLVSALLGLTASCAWPPPPAHTAVPSAAPPPAAAAVPMPPVAEARRWPPLGWLFAPIALSPPPPGRLMLSNFIFDTARVETLTTPFADCVSRPGTAISEFALPLNGSRVIATAPGLDVCWRRAIAPAAGAPPSAPRWTPWNRAYTAAGQAIDSQL